MEGPVNVYLVVDEQPQEEQILRIYAFKKSADSYADKLRSKEPFMNQYVRVRRWTVRR
jgi:hypothetical protein